MPRRAPSRVSDVMPAQLCTPRMTLAYVIRCAPASIRTISPVMLLGLRRGEEAHDVGDILGAWRRA